MTNAERLLLADIERRLCRESPDLDRLLSGRAGVWRRGGVLWWCAGAVTAATTVALVAVGIVLHQPALAVTAVCPPVVFAVVLGLRWSVTRTGGSSPRSGGSWPRGAGPRRSPRLRDA